MKCCLCKREIEIDKKNGKYPTHCAKPVKNGRCCNACNYGVVLPKRLELQGIKR